MFSAENTDNYLFYNLLLASNTMQNTMQPSSSGFVYIIVTDIAILHDSIMGGVPCAVESIVSTQMTISYSKATCNHT